MNVTLLKKSGSKEVINRVELADLAATIKNGMIKDAVRKTRELYHLMNPHRMDDGQITTQLEGGIKLPRICFVADYMNREGATKWSWRESNPRPHKETIRFLHAYLGLHFRAAARPKPPTTTLSPKTSSLHRSLHELFPI